MTSSRADRRPLAWTAAAGLSVLGLIVLNVITAWGSASAPRTPWDEISILQTARWLSGDGSTPPTLGLGYNPGAAFFLAPVWWLTRNPHLVYVLSIVIVIAVGVATVWPLALLGRWCGLQTAPAVVVASIALAFPARTVNADYTLSENFFTWWLVWSVCAAVAFWRRPTYLRAVWLAVAVDLAYFTHARGLVLVAATGIWLLLLAVRHLKVSVFALVVLGLGYVAVQQANSVIQEHVLYGSFGQENVLRTSLRTTNATLITRAMLAQTWAQLIGSAGLVSIGSVVVIRRSWTELRAWRPGPHLLVLGFAASLTLISVLWWSGPRYLMATTLVRLDAWLYTRYIDPIAVVVIVVALATMLRGRLTRTLAGVSVALTVGVIAAVIWYVAPHVPLWGSLNGPDNSAGVLAWSDLWPTGKPFTRPLMPSLTNANRFWIIASIATLVVQVLVLALRRRAVAMLLVAALSAAALSISANPDQVRDPPIRLASSIDHAARISDIPIDTIDVDVECPGSRPARAINWVTYWMSYTSFTYVRPSKQEFTSDVVLSCAHWSQAQERGALALIGGLKYGYRIWVLPSELQDKLKQANLVSFPTDMPREGNAS